MNSHSPFSKMAQLNINHGSWWSEMTTNNNELTIVVVVSLLTLTTLWFMLVRHGDPPSLPPGPRSLPIVGYLPFLTPDLQKQFTKMAHTYGPIFKIYLGSKLHVVINTPELAQEVVRDQDEIFANRALNIAPLVITYGGQDIVMSKNNSNWRKLRKIFVHEVLSHKSLEACSPFRKNEVRKTVRNVFSKIGTVVNVREVSFFTEANVLTRTVWGNSAYKGCDLGVELLKVSWDISEIFGRPNLSDFFPTLAWFDLQGIERDMKRLLNKLDQIFESVIEDRIKASSKNLQDEDGDGDKGNKDFLQILLDHKDQEDAATSLNITQIKAILLDVMIAGTESMATLSEWAMAEIMQNHTIMKRIQKELEEIVGLNNIVQESHLPKLQYLDATLKETFRLHPVVPFLIPRSPSKTCTVGGYTIPKNCTVFLNVWSIHRDPRYWDNPLVFNPERFFSSKGTEKWDYNGNNLKFFPFGSGRRLCPGIQLAEKMQLLILASLLHSFDWSLPNGEQHDLSEKFGVTLKKSKPLIAIPSQRLPDVSLYM